MVLCFSILATALSATPFTHENETLVKHSLDMVSSGWELKQHALADLTINLHNRLKAANLQDLEQLVLQSSDRDHED